QIAQGLTPAQWLDIGDLNGDGQVNNTDLQKLLSLLQSGDGSTTSVPEPSALVLMLAASLLLMLHRRPLHRRYYAGLPLIVSGSRRNFLGLTAPGYFRESLVHGSATA